MKGPKTIEPFFTPKSVAIIGASDLKGTIGYAIFENLRSALDGKAYAVNPKHQVIQGKKSYPTVKDLPEKPDLAVVVTPREVVPKVLRECASTGVKAVVIVTAGFSETGEKKLTSEMLKIIKENPQMRIIGPNCVGIKNTQTGIDTTFFDRSRMKQPRKGTLAFMSQSGALGSMMLDWVSGQEFGISKFVSYGNAMDADESDLLEYFAQDGATKVITMYLEGAREGRKFFSVAKKTSLKKPVVLLKGGLHEKTRVAAESHTGSLAGSERVYEAVFRQAGIIQAESMQDLFATAKLLEKENLPKGRRVQIITNGGGFGILMADHLIDLGIELAEMTPQTKEKIRREIGVEVGNALDLLGDADANRYDTAIRHCLADKNVDVVVVMCLFTLAPLSAENMKILKSPRKVKGKTMVVVAVGGDYTIKQLAQMEKNGFTTYESPHVAARAIAHAAQYSEFIRKSRK